MVSRLTSAVTRAILVMLLIATPSIIVPDVNPDSVEIVALVAIFGGALTLFEYASAYPGLVEFRDAPPFNRIRFLSLWITVIVLSLICKGMTEPTLVTQFMTAIGAIVGYVLDFPYSPVRLMRLMLPVDTPAHQVLLIQIAAGMSYLISLISLCIFALSLRIGKWPNSQNSFNVWINLPTFDPTAGGDVVKRLNRDARVNIVLGFLLPFLIPALVQSAASLFGPIILGNYQSMVWTVSAWAFLPSSLFMRGIAMGRIAEMIEQKRQKTYASVEFENEHLPV